MENKWRTLQRNNHYEGNQSQLSQFTIKGVSQSKKNTLYLDYTILVNDLLLQPTSALEL